MSAASASVVLDVSVQKVLVGDARRVSGWGHVRHQEHLLFSSRNVDNVNVEKT